MGMLRLFLALSVIVHHIPQTPFRWLHASVAVICFFMVSGFYMTLVINEKYRQVDGPWIAQFYGARVSRIFPVYLAMILLMVVWYVYTDTPNVFTDNMGLGFWAQLSLVLMNLFILGQDWHQLTAYSLAGQDANAYTAFIGEHFSKGYFDNSMMLIGQAWTLSIELVFYLLAPFVVHRLHRIVLLLIASLLVRVVFRPLADTFNPLAWGYYFLPSVLCFFLLGSLAYYLYREIIKRPQARRLALPVNVLVLAGVLVVIAMSGYPIIEQATGYDTVALWLFYGAVALCLPFVFLFWKNNRVDRWLGDFSYPVYIVHGVIIGVALGQLGLQKGSYSAQLGIIALSLLAAGMACYFVDSPMDRWRHRRFVGQQGATVSPHASRLLRWAGTAMAVVCLYLGWLTTYSPTQAPPARLVQVEQALRYNIVAYNGKFYGIGFGTPIKWGGHHFEETPGLLIGSSVVEVGQLIRQRADAGLAPTQSAQPRLVKVESALRYNIVAYNNRFYGVQFGTPIEWGGDRYEQTPGLIIGVSQEEVSQAIYKLAGATPQ